MNIPIGKRSHSRWYAVAPDYSVFSDLRYVYTGIPSASGGTSANHFETFGPGVGVKNKLEKNLSPTPEIGMFDFNGTLAGQRANGFGVQYGAVLGFAF